MSRSWRWERRHWHTCSWWWPSSRSCTWPAQRASGSPAACPRPRRARWGRTGDLWEPSSSQSSQWRSGGIHGDGSEARRVPGGYPRAPEHIQPDKPGQWQLVPVTHTHTYMFCAWRVFSVNITENKNLRLFQPDNLKLLGVKNVEVYSTCNLSNVLMPGLWGKVTPSAKLFYWVYFLSQMLVLRSLYANNIYFIIISSPKRWQSRLFFRVGVLSKSSDDTLWKHWAPDLPNQ